MKFTSLLFLCVLMICSRATNATEWYVSAESGADDNAGSLDAPFQTISNAVRRVHPGDTVYVMAGEYRESIDVKQDGEPDKPIRIFAYKSDQPVIKGSQVVTGWTRVKESVPEVFSKRVSQDRFDRARRVWKHENWPTNSQQVFADGRILQQIGFDSPTFPPQGAEDGNWQIHPVGSGIEDMTSGSFYYDRGAQCLYVRLGGREKDPNKVTIEASVAQYLLRTKSYTHVRGLTFTHSSTSSTTRGGAVILKNGSQLEDCIVQWCDLSGVFLGGKGAKLIDCDVSYNGATGVGSNRGEDFLISHCRITRNNYRNFNPNWHAGGIKCIPDAWGTIEHCEIALNNGHGLWFDWCNNGNPIVVRHNFLHDNKNIGIYVEVSTNVKLENNLVLNNPYIGIRLSCAKNALVQHNTIIGQNGFIALDNEGDTGRRDESVDGTNVIRENIIYGSHCYADIHIVKTPDRENVADTVENNIYVRSTDGPRLRCTNGNKAGWKEHLLSRGMDLEKWRKVTGSDAKSMTWNMQIWPPVGDQ